MIEDEFKRFAQHIQSAAESARQAIALYADRQKQIEEQLQAFREINTQALSRAATQAVASFVEMQKLIEPVAREIGRALQELPERNQKALRILAENGWYLDPELSLPELFEAAELFETGAEGSAHQKFCDHFEARLDEIQRDICDRFPNRSRVLESAFNAHRRGEYALSVLAFLAQADGICHELVGVQLYARLHTGIPRLATCLQINGIAPFRASLLYPLVEPFPISAGREERDSQSDQLYRHPIIHGESCDYDTKLNSCRSISLLVYVCWILGRQPTGAI